MENIPNLSVLLLRRLLFLSPAEKRKTSPRGFALSMRWGVIGGLLGIVYLSLGTKGADQHPSPLKFSHSTHVKELAIECEVCHRGTLTSQSGNDRLLPHHQECQECHDVQSASECAVCHTDPSHIVLRPYSRPHYQTFSHQVHSKRLACQECHPKEVGITEQGASIPDMRRCYTCHKTRNLTLGCRKCHLTTIPPAPPSHSVNWKSLHAQESQMDPVSCAMCHQVGSQDDCQKCHQGVGLATPHPRRFNHSQAFLKGKGLFDCQTCHQAESFCASCHLQQMVIPSNHNRTGWAKPQDGGLHAKKARVEFDYCVICHTATIRQANCFSAGCHQ